MVGAHAPYESKVTKGSPAWHIACKHLNIMSSTLPFHSLLRHRIVCIEKAEIVGGTQRY